MKTIYIICKPCGVSPFLFSDRRHRPRDSGSCHRNSRSSVRIVIASAFTLHSPLRVLKIQICCKTVVCGMTNRGGEKEESMSGGCWCNFTVRLCYKLCVFSTSGSY
ncbi:hypothetical protein GQ457_07G032870 [Hibiscus cannabinus]